jgi:hypothetical protein
MSDEAKESVRTLIFRAIRRAQGSRDLVSKSLYSSRTTECLQSLHFLLQLCDLLFKAARFGLERLGRFLSVGAVERRPRRYGPSSPSV